MQRILEDQNEYRHRPDPYYRNAYSATKESRLRLLQFKIIHNIFPSNLLLYRMKIKDSNKCDFCEEIATIEHMFFSCRDLKIFWNFIKSKMDAIFSQRKTINLKDALFDFHFETNTSHKVNEANHLLLLAKSCISKKQVGTRSQSPVLFLEYEINLRKKHFPSLNLIQE